ncbi:MAG: hypothetical protein NAG76_13910 [Candidatus Pristimantibacillus lignocellulolyticus]|uniref:Cation efflux protein cytoplasmic domain-containing protein n=1 Tax=Candidatus Pristimantibacillus lignocellulolyticus TaxID=2994561 RepID=A0A9J6ZAR9_9BACL|nr:MAG: hypothetical protein NAG76_13910 [Candidatus Pristimantibacillus lignocellulolyticus]
MSVDVEKQKSLLNKLMMFFSKSHLSHNCNNDSDSTERILQVVQRINGVVAIESCEAKEQGHYVVASLTINVNPKITVQEGQDIAKRVRMLLMHRFTHLTDVVVHVKPFAPDYPYKSNHSAAHDEVPTILQ